MTNVAQSVMRKAALKKSHRSPRIKGSYLDRMRKPVDIKSAPPEFQKYLAKLNENQRAVK